MLILLEGVDGSGKTTLCNQLKEKGFTVKKAVNRLDRYAYSKWFELSQLKDYVIVDRSFITELVYRTVDDKKRGTMSLKKICMMLQFCKIVLCDTDTAYEDSINRGEDNVTDIETSNKIRLTYNTIIRMIKKFTNVKTFTYDWKHQTVDDVINFIYKEE